jgi:O-antigen ligase
MPAQITRAKGRDRSPGWIKQTQEVASLRRRPFVFGAIVVFLGLYYYRPEDFIQPLAYIPMAKVVGIIGFGALIIGIMGGGKVQIPKAIKILLLLLLHMTLCIPFALWKGGAFNTVWGKFSKGVVVAMLISMAVVTLKEVRKLVWIQLSAVALVTILSIALHNYNPGGRLAGIQNSILSNPNDLAINIAITFPLGLAFLLQGRGFKRLLWVPALAFMCLGVVLTSSRSGLLALIISVGICVWEYGVKGKRPRLVLATVLALVLGLGLAFSSAHYRARVESIVMGDIEGSGDKGSRAARLGLLKKSVVVALTHPIFGVGPGCFPLVDAQWVVAHNAYTELAAEAGLPALALFLMAMFAAFQNLAVVRKSQRYKEDAELRLLTQALWAGLVAYLAGSFFASTEYNMYPYFIIGYTSAFVKIVSVPFVPADNDKDQDPGLKSSAYPRAHKPQMLWS